MEKNKKIKLHLGCGKRLIPGFVHIDKDHYDHVDYQRNIKDLSIFDNNSIDIIYVCHCFNYLDEDEAKKALKEWYRVLKIGGILRIAVPDFAAIVKAYLKFKDLHLVKRLVTGYYKIKSDVEYHRTVYDEDTLKNLLLECGFSKISRYDWRSTSHSKYDDYSQAYLPHMDKESGIHMSLNLEAVK